MSRRLDYFRFAKLVTSIAEDPTLEGDACVAES